LQHGERMEDKDPSIVDAQTQTEVYDVSSCSISSQCETNMGMNILTKMGYIGGGLGIHGQGVTQSLEVVQRPRFASFGYSQDDIGECSKSVEARATSKTISTSLDSKRGVKSSIPSPRQIYNNDKPGRYKGHVQSNSFFDFKKHDSCNMHSCTRSSNRDVAKNHKKKTWVKKTSTSTGSATKQNETLSRPHDKEILLREHEEIIAVIVI